MNNPAAAPARNRLLVIVIAAIASTRGLVVRVRYRRDLWSDSVLAAVHRDQHHHLWLFNGVVAFTFFKIVRALTLQGSDIVIRLYLRKLTHSFEPTVSLGF